MWQASSDEERSTGEAGVRSSRSAQRWNLLIYLMCNPEVSSTQRSSQAAPCTM